MTPIKEQLEILKTIMTKHGLGDVAEGIEKAVAARAKAFEGNGFEGAAEYCAQFSPLTYMAFEYAAGEGHPHALLAFMRNISTMTSRNPQPDSTEAAPHRSVAWRRVSYHIGQHLLTLNNRSVH